MGQPSIRAMEGCGSRGAQQIQQAFSSRVEDMGSGREEPFVKEEHCEQAEEFLEKLSPRQGGVCYVEPSGSYRDTRLHWLYRGQADNDHSLIPSAFRKGPLAARAMTGSLRSMRRSKPLRVFLVWPMRPAYRCRRIRRSLGRLLAAFILRST